ncbi:hypothetical protein D3C72_2251620 [compost metagenome]
MPVASSSAATVAPWRAMLLPLSRRLCSIFWAAVVMKKALRAVIRTPRPSTRRAAILRDRLVCRRRIMFVSNCVASTEIDRLNEILMMIADPSTPW